VDVSADGVEGIGSLEDVVSDVMFGPDWIVALSVDPSPVDLAVEHPANTSTPRMTVALQRFLIGSRRAC
jgi:hypothetical protein